MLLERKEGASLAVLAPAKLNLFLEVRAKRPDGFHEIETLMVPTTLHDSLIFTENDSGAIELTCQLSAELARCVPVNRRAPMASCEVAKSSRGELADAPAMPEGESNSVVRALRLLQETTGSRRGIRVQLIKRIPLAAGLAGGSADAAAALVAGNRLWKTGLSRAELAKLAAQLGSDIPFFLEAGAAICRGRGELIEPVGLPAGLWFVLAYPRVGLGTAEVYRACQPATESCLPAVGLGCCLGLIAALSAGRLARAAEQMMNRLQPAAESLCPAVTRLGEEFRRLDFVVSQMSGSGTTWFGLCHHRRHARRLAAALRSRSVGDVYTVSSTC